MITNNTIPLIDFITQGQARKAGQAGQGSKTKHFILFDRLI